MKAEKMTNKATSKAREYAGTALKYAVASGMVDRALRRGLKARRMVPRMMRRKPRRNVPGMIARGFFGALAVVSLVLVGTRLLRRESDTFEMTPNYTPPVTP